MQCLTFGYTGGMKEAFAPYLDQINLCECADCRATHSGLDLPWQAKNRQEARAALLAKLQAGTHVHMTLAQRAAEARQEKAQALADAQAAGYSPAHIEAIERGYATASMRDFYATGMGIGMTPGSYSGAKG